MPQGMSIQIFSPLYTRYKHFRQSSSLALQSLDIHAVPHCHQELGRLSIVELVVTHRDNEEYGSKDPSAHDHCEIGKDWCG